MEMAVAHHLNKKIFFLIAVILIIRLLIDLI